LIVQLVSKLSNLCDPDPSTSQTDRQTDGRHAISIPRYALVHHAVKSVARQQESQIREAPAKRRCASRPDSEGWSEP